MNGTRQLRELLARQLDWEDAHVGYRRAVSGFRAELRGVVPEGLVHSGWQLIEHIRLVQADILDFCINPGYVEPESMDEYWPSGSAPADDAAWEASIAGFESDLRSLRSLALDESVDLYAPIPHGDGQTYLRELLLAVDHTAYEVGQLVLVRRLLGCWP
jgi:hypothetical protein